MKRAILVDGNNLMFRSYYATAYSGSIMKNSNGTPTNALFGFVNMINKIISEEKPEYMMVAFDIGKNFRHEKYKEYKDGRIETPNDLKLQFPIAKEILTYMGIKYLEIENYEADDIIGTFARMADEDKMYDATIVSSDKDLLQLISDDVNVKLLKQKDYIWMDTKTFKETYGIEPIRIIDLKALWGDASDNIPGVKGIGEKTALNLLQQFDTIENLYDHIDEVKGKVKDKLILDKDNAFFSKELATIYKEVPLNVTFEDIKMQEVNEVKLMKLFEELEFYSFIKKINKPIKNNDKLDIKIVKDKITINPNSAYYIECDDENYHIANIIGMSIYDGVNSYYLDKDAIILNKDIFNNMSITYDYKKNIVLLNKLGIKIDSSFDTLIASYLLNYNVKDDVSYLANMCDYKIDFYENIVNKKKPMDMDNVINNICLKAKFLYETKDKFYDELVNEKELDLFNDIEMPLVSVLASMEIEGIHVSKDILKGMEEGIISKLDSLSNEIYDLCGIVFNINSPKQLSDILYEKLNLPHGKKLSTDVEHLNKLKKYHPVIEKILEYRNLNKLYTTYIASLGDYILDDGKIHTIFKQTIARTGRLSSVLPNLQNIPIRSEEGRKIRKAFLPENDCVLLSSDYSQIELRVLAQISECKELIDAFNNSEDIHSKVASDIFGIPMNEVTKNQRRCAKAVIFGIVYGISGYGLGENLEIDYNEAKKFIDKYLTMYPGVKDYMDNTVKKAKETFSVRTMFNRKRIIDELKNTNYMIRSTGERIAMNTPIQGSSADIIKLAMINVYNELNKRNLKSKIIIQVHDELVLNVYNDELEEVKKLVKDVMENVIKLSVPLKVEIDYGADWYEAK